MFCVPMEQTLVHNHSVLRLSLVLQKIHLYLLLSQIQVFGTLSVGILTHSFACLRVSNLDIGLPIMFYDTHHNNHKSLLCKLLNTSVPLMSPLAFRS